MVYGDDDDHYRENNQRDEQSQKQRWVVLENLIVSQKMSRVAVQIWRFSR